ncbi:peptidoglycan DD-metalloendopeptidase family protein [Paenibacillus sp. strain BS8-2]
MTRARKPTWSFVVMRGADKTVKQFSVSKRSVLAAPMAAVLAVSGCIAGLQMKAAYELKQLEEQLSDQSSQYNQTTAGMDAIIAGKDEAIVTLQQKLLELSRQTQEMKDKMQELSELEAKLQSFIEKYGSATLDTTSAPSSRSASNVRTLASSYELRGSSVYSPAPQHTAQIASLAERTSLDLQALSLMVDSMETSMEQTLRMAQNKRKSVDGYPSFWPTRSKQMTSGFGYRRDPFTGRAAFHAGIDIDGRSGDAVFSAADGNVTEVGYDSQYGNYVIIAHPGNLQTAYMHLERSDAREGDLVVRGEKIGQLGSSGRSTGPHLHFQIMQRSEPVNPLNYLATRS